MMILGYIDDLVADVFFCPKMWQKVCFFWFIYESCGWCGGLAQTLLHQCALGHDGPSSNPLQLQHSRDQKVQVDVFFGVGLNSQ